MNGNVPLVIVKSIAPSLIPQFAFVATIARVGCVEPVTVNESISTHPLPSVMVT